jgi:hypothetical protein
VPSVRSTTASVAACERWAAVPDRVAATLPAREGRWQRYLDRARELAPIGASDEEIEYRADLLRRADMKRMSLAGVKARQARKTGGAGDDRAA